MPTLKQITCTVELGSAHIPLPEYGVSYTDGQVDSFIAIPETDVPFTIRLQTNGYIAPGIAAFAFIDGEYHCNRNRTGLTLPSASNTRPHGCDTEFRLRQKEEKTADGKFVTRDWTFAKLSRAADKASDANSAFLANVGRIEVVVLRCASDASEDMIERRNQGARNAASPKGKSKKAPDSSQKAKDKTSSSFVKRTSVVKKSAPPSSKASEAAASDPFAGLFGLFDGTGDSTEGSCLIFDDDPADPTCISLGQVQLDGPSGDSRRAPEEHISRDRMNGLQHPHLNRANARNVPALADIDLMEDVIQELHLLSTPSSVLTVLREKIQEDEVNIRLDPGTQYDEPALNPQDMQCQLKTVQRDSQRLQRFLDAAMTASSGYRCLLMEARIADLTHKETALVAAIGHAGPLPRPGQYSHPPGETGSLVKRPTPLQMVRHQIDGTPPGTFLDIEAAAKVVQAHEERHGVASTINVWEDLFNWQKQAGANPDLPSPGTDVWGCRGGDVDDPDAWKAFARQLRSRKQVLQRFCSMTERCLPDCDLSDIQRYCVRLDCERDGALQRHSTIVSSKEGILHPSPLAPQTGDGQQSNQWSPTPGWQEVGQGSAQCKDGNEKQWWQQENASSLTSQSTSRSKGAQDRKSQRSTSGGWPASNKDQGQSQRNTQRSNSGGWAAPNKGQGQSQPNEWTTSPADAENKWEQKSHNSHKSKRNDTSWGNACEQNNGNNVPDMWGKASNNANPAENKWNSSRPATQRSRTSSQPKVSEHARASSTRPIREQREPSIKPYWAQWNKPSQAVEHLGRESTTNKPALRQVYQYPAERLPVIPEGKISDREYGVQVSRGTAYTHVCREPSYIDTMESPYAVFRFKYRSREKLEEILKTKIDGKTLRQIEQEAEREKLQSMPKQQLVEEVMKVYKSKEQRTGHGSDPISKHGEPRGSQRGGSKHPASSWGNKEWKTGEDDASKSVTGNRWDGSATRKGRSKSGSVASKATAEHFSGQMEETRGNDVTW